MEQDLDNQARPSADAIHLCGKSWIAYIGVGVRTLIIIALFVALIYWQPDYWAIATGLLVLALLLIGYRIAWLRSFRLYYDEAGVWIFSGILPWKRGVRGVKWRDLDEAVFINSFWSWLAGSYSVVLKHRFTKDMEIAEDTMARGKEAVLTINQQHRQRIQQSPIL